jgi:1-deoxy-D-xylulose-5-phosphate synthase
MKGMVLPGSMFEEMGFNYIGPLDGHDLQGLIHTFENIRDGKGPQFLHLVTTKGKGFGPAERSPVSGHSLAKIESKDASQAAPSTPSYSEILGDFLCDLAACDERLAVITPAMKEGSGLVAFAERYPERFFDVAIAEQHALTFAAGLATQGMKPVVAIYSTFLQRAYDQLVHDLALQRLDVLLAIDRAGLLEDGPTHSGAFDLSYLRCIPDLVIMAPSDEQEARRMLYTGYAHQGPAAVRYPRGAGPGAAVAQEFAPLPIGRALVRRTGADVAILAFGAMVQPAMEAAATLDATVVDMRFVKPLDEALILQVCERHRLIVTVEENALRGGAGSAVNEFILGASIGVAVLNLGIDDRFVPQEKPAAMLASCGLSAEGIAAAVHERLQQLARSAPGTKAPLVKAL